MPRPRRLEIDKALSDQNPNMTLASNATIAWDAIAILVFCATRENAIRNHLEQLVKQRPSPEQFPIFVSQDTDTAAVQKVIEEFVKREKNVFYMQVSVLGCVERGWNGEIFVMRRYFYWIYC